jgi:uncharacterized integral membrane protein
MAEHQTHSSGDPSSEGTMDIAGHVKTWLAFWNGVKWSAIFIILIAVLLAIFRTHNG